MRTSLLTADLDEFERTGADVGSAFARGARSLGCRQLHERLLEPFSTEAGLTELVDLYAEAYAQMHLLRFGYMSKAEAYANRRNGTTPSTTCSSTYGGTSSLLFEPVWRRSDSVRHSSWRRPKRAASRRLR